jgi:hypothetical protein
VRRRGRHYLPKLRGKGRDQVALGADAPYGPVGLIAAHGKIARAAVSPNLRQRRAGSLILLAIFAPPALLLLIGLVHVLTH